MRRYTPLDPGSEVGIQQLELLFIGQSANDIRKKLQKLKTTESRNLETLLDEAWRVFSNREEDQWKDRCMLVAALQESREPRLEGFGRPQKPLERHERMWCN